MTISLAIKARTSQFVLEVVLKENQIRTRVLQFTLFYHMQIICYNAHLAFVQKFSSFNQNIASELGKKLKILFFSKFRVFQKLYLVLQNALYTARKEILFLNGFDIRVSSYSLYHALYSWLRKF